MININLFEEETLNIVVDTNALILATIYYDVIRNNWKCTLKV